MMTNKERQVKWRAYYKANREKLLKYQKEWYAKNVDKVKAWRERNRDKISAYQIAYRKRQDGKK